MNQTPSPTHEGASGLHSGRKNVRDTIFRILYRGGMRLWENRIDLAILSVCVVTGIVVRTGHLDYAFNPDEAGLITTSRMPLRDIFLGMSWEKHPFGSYVIRHFMLMLSSEADYLRLLSIVPGVLTIPVMYWIGVLQNRTTATILALMAVFSPGLVVQGQLFRHYALLVFAVALATLGLALILKNKKPGWSFLTVGLCLAVLTHYSGWFVAAGLILIIVTRFWFFKNAPTNSTRQIIILIFSVLGAVALCIPRLFLPVQSEDLKKYYASLLEAGTPTFFDRWSGEIEYLFGTGSVIPVTIALVAGIFLLAKRNPWLAAFSIGLLLAAIGLEITNFYPLAGRYSIYLFCALSLLLAEPMGAAIQPCLKFMQKRLSKTSGQFIFVLSFAAVTGGIVPRYMSEMSTRYEFTIHRNEFNYIWNALISEIEDDAVIISDFNGAMYLTAFYGKGRYLPGNWLHIRRGSVTAISRADGFGVLTIENMNSALRYLKAQKQTTDNVWVLHLGWWRLSGDIRELPAYLKKFNHPVWEVPSGTAVLFKLPKNVN